MYRINKNDLRTFLLWLICSVLGIEVSVEQSTETNYLSQSKSNSPIFYLSKSKSIRQKSYLSKSKKVLMKKLLFK
jgi:hypothetical protein